MLKSLVVLLLMVFTMQLEGTEKVVVITGVSRGIGLSLAKEYAHNGWTVAGCSRSEEGIANVKRQLGDKHDLAVVDVCNDEEVSRWAQRVIEKLGAPDTLFNNAGTINRPAATWEVSASEFNTVMSVNVIGSQNCLRHFVPAMIKRGAGTIINMSSWWGSHSETEYSPYCASKFAIEGLTKCLALELPPGLIAVTLDPGAVDTDLLRFAIGSGGGFPTPEEWIVKAFPFIMKISSEDNGKTLIVP